MVAVQDSYFFFFAAFFAFFFVAICVHPPFRFCTEALFAHAPL